MSFSRIEQKIKGFSHVRTIHFAIINTPAMRVGKVTIPAPLVADLGWTTNSNINVEAGSDGDAGWYRLTVNEDPNAHHRARFTIARNGVGRFATKALVPPEVTGPVHNFKPDYKIDEGALLIKVI